MLLADFFRWWYGAGWQLVVSGAGHGFGRVFGLFSAPLLLRTLFAPWRRIISYPSASLDAKMRAWADNAFSRVVGFIIRVTVLLAALLSAALWALMSLFIIVSWPLWPVFIPVSIVLGVAS